jgi:hypothetical protein
VAETQLDNSIVFQHYETTRLEQCEGNSMCAKWHSANKAAEIGQEMNARAAARMPSMVRKKIGECFFKHEHVLRTVL